MAVLKKGMRPIKKKKVFGSKIETDVPLMGFTNSVLQTEFCLVHTFVHSFTKVCSKQTPDIQK